VWSADGPGPAAFFIARRSREVRCERVGVGGPLRRVGGGPPTRTCTRQRSDRRGRAPADARNTKADGRMGRVRQGWCRVWVGTTDHGWSGSIGGGGPLRRVGGGPPTRTCTRRRGDRRGRAPADAVIDADVHLPTPGTPRQTDACAGFGRGGAGCGWGRQIMGGPRPSAAADRFGGWAGARRRGRAPADAVTDADVHPPTRTCTRRRGRAPADADVHPPTRTCTRRRPAPSVSVPAGRIAPCLA